MTSTSEGILASIFHGFQWAWGSNWEAMLGSFFNFWRYFWDVIFKHFCWKLFPRKPVPPKAILEIKCRGRRRRRRARGGKEGQAPPYPEIWICNSTRHGPSWLRSDWGGGFKGLRLCSRPLWNGTKLVAKSITSSSVWAFKYFTWSTGGWYDA